MIKKAYKLTVDGILDEPWHYDDIVVYADSHGQAKSKGLNSFDTAEVYDYNSYKNCRYVEFKDIKARRIRKLDKIFYNGEWRTNQEISNIKWEEERDDEARKIWEDNPDGIALIWVGCYGSYWGANRSGYFSSIEAAGKYSTKEAYEIVKGNDYSRQEKVILLNVAEYNLKIENKIKELQKQLI